MTLLHDACLERLNEYLVRNLGISFSDRRLRDLDRGARAAAKDFGFDCTAAFVDWLLSVHPTKKLLSRLANHITVGETYFFRDPAAFRLLQEKVLPELIQLKTGANRRVRVWSAGCCTGEETYSIAMVLRRVLPARDGWDVRVIGTDVTGRFLERAERGVYGDWSMRGLTDPDRSRFFQMEGDCHYRVNDAVRSAVTFGYHNLAGDDNPLGESDPFDIIFCRNLLIYMEAPQALAIVQRLKRRLAPGGYLFVAATEASHNDFSELRTVHAFGAMCYQRVSLAVGEAPHTRDGDTHDVRQKVPSIQERAGGQDIDQELRSPDRVWELTVSPHRAPKPTENTPHSPLPTKSDCEITTARNYANAGRFDDALELCSLALISSSDDARIHCLRGHILQEMGRWNDAVEAFQAALYLDASMVAPQVALGGIALRTGRDAEARRSFERALRLLESLPPEEPIAELEGITAARLVDTLRELCRSKEIT